MVSKSDPPGTASADASPLATAAAPQTTTVETLQTTTAVSPQIAADSDINRNPDSDLDLVNLSTPAKASATTSTDAVSLCSVVELQANTEDFPKNMSFKSPPNMLDLCIVDSMMPSPRFLQKLTQDQSIIHPPSSIQFGDEMAMQTGPSTLSVSKPKPAIQAKHNHHQPSIPPSVAKTVATKPFNSIQGAWKVPLKISNPEIPTLRYNSESLLSEYDSEWPSIASGAQTRTRKPLQAPQASSKPHAAVRQGSLASTDLDSGLQSSEYPWAAKMKPSVRNLHRVTTPTFMEDGTPKVCIPKQVLLEGVENQKEFIIGQFYRCVAPTGGQIHAVMSRLWGKKCRIFTRKLGEASFLFHIPDEATRIWILQRGLWHVDDCLMFVSSWNPAGTIAIPEITTIPVWLTLKNIPNQLYSTKGINWIGSGLGAPLLTSKPWLDPSQMGEAKILVEVKLDKPFPPKVAIEDESGSITMVDVIYSWLPPKCGTCGQLGHKATRCLGIHTIHHGKPPSSTVNVTPAKTALPPTSEDAASKKTISEPAQASVSAPCHIQDSTVPTKVTNSLLVGQVAAVQELVTVVQEPVTAAQECNKSVIITPIDAPTTEDNELPENMEITHPTAATFEAGTTSAESASLNDANIISGDHSFPASSVGNDECDSQGNGEDSMKTLHDEDPLDGCMKTQSGRTVKPSQKLQEMEWSTVKTRGRKGRGGSHG